MKELPLFVKFTASSLFATIFDLGLFTVFEKLLLSWGTGEKTAIFSATIGARIIATVINFFINKYWCFKSEDTKKTLKESVLFFILFAVKIVLSFSIVTAFRNAPVPHLTVKTAADVTIFFLSYIVQKKWIFASEA